MTAVTAPPRRAWVQQVMGLPVSVHVRGPHAHDAAVQARVDLLYADLRRADAVFSTYRDGSDLSRWQRRELTLNEADPDLAGVLALCDEATARTDGWFDARDLPDPRTGTARFDPSGLVKGWATERAAARLSTLDGHGWCVNAGGDIIVSTPPGHPPWRIGVENPADPSRVLQILSRTGGAVATSGTARRGQHILDPHTGRPATAVQSVTVIGPSLLWADVYATAAAARGPSALPWLATLPGYEALMLDTTAHIHTTPAWPL